MPRSQPGAGGLARDIRQVFALAGLPESAEDDPVGGYHISSYGDRVKVSWGTESGFYDQAGSIGVSHPPHPKTRLDRMMISVMERALADVLYAAGFTVLLRPGIPNADPEKERDPELIVVAGPDFKAWVVLHRPGNPQARSSGCSDIPPGAQVLLSYEARCSRKPAPCMTGAGRVYGFRAGL